MHTYICKCTNTKANILTITHIDTGEYTDALPAYQNPPTREYSTGCGSRQATMTSKCVCITPCSQLKTYCKNK